MMQCGWPLLGPLEWIRYIDKQVKVKAGKQEHRGWMFTVDPVSARTMMQCGWPLLGPLEWIRYIDKQVKVKAGKQEHRGWMFTVDPVSASVVLVDFSQAGASVRVVMGHAVEEVEVLQDADPETIRRLRAAFVLQKTPRLDPQELRTRKGDVRRWLEKNRVPVEEEGDELRVAKVLTISAPYGPEDCCSSNQIILDRVQRLIRIKPGHPGPETDPDQTGSSWTRD